MVLVFGLAATQLGSGLRGIVAVTVLHAVTASDVLLAGDADAVAAAVVAASAGAVIAIVIRVTARWVSLMMSCFLAPPFVKRVLILKTRGTVIWSTRNRDNSGISGTIDDPLVCRVVNSLAPIRLWGMASPKLAALELSAGERQVLEAWARRRKTAQALALRSRIVLACAGGAADMQVAETLGVSRATVAKWRSRFAAHRLEVFPPAADPLHRPDLGLRPRVDAAPGRAADDHRRAG
jgi:hypothetical protein